MLHVPLSFGEQIEVNTGNLPLDNRNRGLENGSGGNGDKIIRTRALDLDGGTRGDKPGADRSGRTSCMEDDDRGR